MTSPPSPSSTASTRALITQYLSHLSSRDFAALASLFASPSTPYWVLGSPSDPPFAGTQPISARLPQLESVLGSFSRFSFRVDGFVCEGEQAVVYGQVLGEGPGEGRRYAPEVVMAFRVREGRIVEKREWVDNSTVLEWAGRLEEERRRGEGKGEGE
ncbi:hypothetical protein F4810DRAFT_684090 [Camillea tinctor]|nr:hypothetical protein F4810DRAFT_684090 [Camillea tinctor]